VNGNKFEIEFTMGTRVHQTWAADEEVAKLVAEALKAHPPVESVRVVSFLSLWTRPKYEAAEARS
jgi:hypothetical protein